MLIAKNQFNQLIQADQAIPGQFFSCPGCQQPLRLKKGEINLPHFAHLPGQACDYFSENESRLHLQAKKLLSAAVRMPGWTEELEKVFPQIQQRADLWLQDDQGRQLAIEFQQSPISIGKLRQRTAGYERIGMKVLWILGPNYFHKRLSEKTAFKFADRHERIFYWQPTAATLQVFSHFHKNDLSPLQMQRQDYGLTDFFHLYLANNLPTSQPASPAKKIDSCHDLQQMQRQLSTRRLSAETASLAYEHQGKSPILAPWLIHGGHQAGLKVTNWHWRLAMLLKLESAAPTDLLSKAAFVKTFSSDKFFFERSVRSSFAERAVVNFLRELAEQGYLCLKKSYIVILELPRWPDSYQQKLALLR